MRGCTQDDVVNRRSKVISHTVTEEGSKKKQCFYLYFHQAVADIAKKESAREMDCAADENRWLAPHVFLLTFHKHIR